MARAVSLVKVIRVRHFRLTARRLTRACSIETVDGPCRGRIFPGANGGAAAKMVGHDRLVTVRRLPFSGDLEVVGDGGELVRRLPRRGRENGVYLRSATVAGSACWPFASKRVVGALVGFEGEPASIEAWAKLYRGQMARIGWWDIQPARHLHTCIEGNPRFNFAALLRLGADHRDWFPEAAVFSPEWRPLD